MKLQADIGGEMRDVEIRREGRDVRATVDGREYSLDVSQPEPHTFLIKNDSEVYEAYVADDGNTVGISGQSIDVKILDPKRLRGGSAAGADDSGKAEIRTAMPGKVVRIVVAQGNTVEKGASVIVVEAMKMQNEMKAPKAGTIVEVRVAEGDTVGAGDLLVVIE